MDSKEYIKDESKYNTLFAFGSLSVGRQNAPLGGPMPVLLNGDFSRKIGSLIADDHQIPSFDQLYILDSQAATNCRINSISFDDGVKKIGIFFGFLMNLSELIILWLQFFKILMNFTENLNKMILNDFKISKSF